MGVILGVRVNVTVGVGVGVSVGVLVCVAVSVYVGVGVSVGPSICPGPQADSMTLIIIRLIKIRMRTTCRMADSSINEGPTGCLVG